MADGQTPFERLQGVLIEDVRDQAHGDVPHQFLAVGRNDPGGFLAAMLQRVQPEIRQARGIRGDAERP